MCDGDIVVSENDRSALLFVTPRLTLEQRATVLSAADAIPLAFPAEPKLPPERPGKGDRAVPGVRYPLLVV
jgi:hypothetical protein